MLTEALDGGFFRSLPYHAGKYGFTYGNVQIESQLEDLLFGRSYLGFHAGLQVPVVVRVFPPATRERPMDYQRFREDARRVGLVRHPSIAAIHEVGEHQNHTYLIVEYVAGVPLSERIKALPLEGYHALSLLLPVAEGLSELWRKGYIHRCVNPQHLCLPADGPPKLEVKTLLPRQPIDTESKRHLTPIMAPYWSPEEVEGRASIDGRADMWSFGAVLFHAVTGKPPFRGVTLEAVLQQVVEGEPRDPREVNPSLHPSLRELLLTLLHKKPAQRFQTAEEFLAALREVQEQLAQRLRDEKTAIIPHLNTGRPVARGIGKEADTDVLVSGKPHLFELHETIANCRLDQEIGAGPTGVVYRARHKVLDIDVAVKLLSPKLAAREPVFLELFLREARTAARIRHPNVLALFEAGAQEGQHYLIMEYAGGGTVKDRMLVFGGKLPPEQAVRILLGVARGLSAAEKLNIIHRNIKPDNLMFGAGDEVKIADLGLAKRIRPADGGTVHESMLADQITQRLGGAPLSGAPAYMAPEMALDPLNADIRADLYSLGVSAYYMLLGTLPFQGKSAVELMRKHQEEQSISPRRQDPKIPVALSDLVTRLLAKKPDERYASAAALAQALEALPLGSADQPTQLK